MIYVRYALVIPGMGMVVCLWRYINADFIIIIMGMVAVVVLRPVVKRVGAICSFRAVRQAWDSVPREVRMRATITVAVGV